MHRSNRSDARIFRRRGFGGGRQIALRGAVLNDQASREFPRDDHHHVLGPVLADLQSQINSSISQCSPPSEPYPMPRFARHPEHGSSPSLLSPHLLPLIILFLTVSNQTSSHLLPRIPPPSPPHPPTRPNIARRRQRRTLIPPIGTSSVTVFMHTCFLSYSM